MNFNFVYDAFVKNDYHEDEHTCCSHHNNKVTDTKLQPVYVSRSGATKDEPFFIENNYMVFEDQNEVKETNQKKLVISHPEGTIIDLATLDYIVLKPGVPDKVLISACKTAVKDDGKTSVIEYFIPGEDTIELRCSKKQLTLKDVSVEVTTYDNTDITLLTIQGGSGLAGIAFLGQHPELMQSITIDVPPACHH